MELMQSLDIRPLLPELFLCISAVILLMTGVFRGNRITPVLTAGAAMALLFTLYMLWINIGGGRASFQGMFVSDMYTSFCKALVLLGGLLTLGLSARWLREEENRRFEFVVLLLFAILGMMLMISASDLLALYMGLELSSLALYVLAAFSRDNLRSTEAGLKYFVLGSLASGIMLFGMSLIYGFVGTTSFAGIADTISQTIELHGGITSHGAVLGLVLLLVGFFFKISAAPFHMWTPDVYQGAPTPVTAFFAIAPKAAALFLLMRVLEQPFAEMKLYWQQIVIFVAILSMFAGAFGALTQTNIKRLLAYSSIGHVGYALVGVAAGGFAGVQSVLIYLALYIFMSAGAFGCVLCMRRKGTYLEEISDLSGISKIHPQLALVLAVLMFSMAGIPPLAGFFGKMYVFLAAIGEGLYALAVVGVLSSVIACYYYLKLVKVMYFDEGAAVFDRQIPQGVRLVVGVSVIVVALFVFFPAPLVRIAGVAAQALWL